MLIDFRLWVRDLNVRLADMTGEFAMSALPPKADIRPRDQDVCFGPIPDSVERAQGKTGSVKYAMRSTLRWSGRSMEYSADLS